MANAQTTTGITLNKAIWCLSSLTLAWLGFGPLRAEPALFQSQRVTPAGEYTFGIEGPAVDAAGTSSIFRRPEPLANFSRMQ